MEATSYCLNSFSRFEDLPVPSRLVQGINGCCSYQQAMDRRPLVPIPVQVNVNANLMEKMKHQQQQQLRNGKENKNVLSAVPRFPITKAILWNRNQTGKSLSINFSREKKIRMYLSEKTLLLASKHGNSNNGFLVGSFITESDGILLQVDRFDPGRNIQLQTGDGLVVRRVPTAVIPGDHTISLKMNQALYKGDKTSMLDRDLIQQDLQILNSRICKKHPVNIPDLFISHVSCHCQTDVDELIIDIFSSTVVFAAEFEAKPINDVPIIPTALAKNLGGTMRLSQFQGTPKFGYLTMDQTRKLLLLLETDPKIESLPLVGIWVSGVIGLCNPYVWACCLRFMRADYIKERVLAPPAAFLLIHYPTTKAYPDFFECQPKQTSDDFKRFDILSCKEQFLISSSSRSGLHGDICIDLTPEDQGEHDDLKTSVLGQPAQVPQQKSFSESGSDGQPGSKESASKDLARQYSDCDDGMPTPRPSPKPHSRTVEPHPSTPSVPELSVIEMQTVKTPKAKPYNPKMYQEVSRSQENNNKGSPNPHDTPILPVNYRRQQFETRRSEQRIHEVDPLNISDVDGVPIQANSATDNYTLSHTPDPNADQRRSQAALPSVAGRGNVAVTKNTHLKSNTADARNNKDRVISYKHVVEDDHQIENDFFDQISVAMTNDKATVQTASEIGREGYGLGQGNMTQVEENGEKEVTQNGSNPMSVIADHERQLLELREQIRVLLELKQQEELASTESMKAQVTSRTNTSVQCSMVDIKPETASVSVNTGESLLFDLPGTSRGNESDICSCCSKCKRKLSKRESTRPRSNTRNGSKQDEATPLTSKRYSAHVGSASFLDQSCSLSDIQDMDIQNLSTNQVSASMQSFASDLQAVDLPVFEDSQNAGPASPNDLALGTSASMVYEKQRQDKELKESLQNENQTEESKHVDESEIEEADFYQQMVEDVKGLLSNQTEEDEESGVDTAENNDSNLKDTKMAGNSNESEIMENITKATMKQLQILGAKSPNQMLTVNTVNSQAPVQTDTAPFHPRINYISMFANDTSDDENLLADEIAMKYLTSNQRNNIKYNVTQRTKSVKFEGVYDDVCRTPKLSMNFVSMNLTCNMSVASKRYMERYNLIQHDKLPVFTDASPEENDRQNAKLKSNSKGSKTNQRLRDREQMEQNSPDKILDLDKLKCLPKLI